MNKQNKNLFIFTGLIILLIFGIIFKKKIEKYKNTKDMAVAVEAGEGVSVRPSNLTPQQKNLLSSLMPLAIVKLLTDEISNAIKGPLVLEMKKINISDNLKFPIDLNSEDIEEIKKESEKIFTEIKKELIKDNNKLVSDLIKEKILNNDNVKKLLRKTFELKLNEDVTMLTTNEFRKMESKLKELESKNKDLIQQLNLNKQVLETKNNELNERYCYLF